MRKLQQGKMLSEHGIIFTRKPNGDGQFSINLMVDGQRIHRSFGRESAGVTRQHVEDYIEKVKTDAREGRFQLTNNQRVILNFSCAADRYLTKLEQCGGKDMKSKRQQLRDHLKPFFTNKKLTAITTGDVERYKEIRKKTGVTVATINRELSVLSHLLNRSVEWKWIANKPCVIKKFPENRGRITYLTQAQITDLIEASKCDQNPHIHAFIRIGLGTSMRMNEILSIQIKNVDIARRIIFIPKAKAGAREQPMTGKLAKFLAERIQQLGPSENWLFPSKTSKTGYANNIVKAFQRVVVAAGLNQKEVVRHTLRHTAITHLVQSGVDLPTVQRVSGHKTLSMVLRYSHQNGSHIQQAMEKLEQRVS